MKRHTRGLALLLCFLTLVHYPISIPVGANFDSASDSFLEPSSNSGESNLSFETHMAADTAFEIMSNANEATESFENKNGNSDVDSILETNEAGEVSSEIISNENDATESPANIDRNAATDNIAGMIVVEESDLSTEPSGTTQQKEPNSQNSDEKYVLVGKEAPTNLTESETPETVSSEGTEEFSNSEEDEKSEGLEVSEKSEANHLETFVPLTGSTGQSQEETKTEEEQNNNYFSDQPQTISEDETGNLISIGYQTDEETQLSEINLPTSGRENYLEPLEVLHRDEEQNENDEAAEPLSGTEGQELNPSEEAIDNDQVSMEIEDSLDDTQYALEAKKANLEAIGYQTLLIRQGETIQDSVNIDGAHIVRIEIPEEAFNSDVIFFAGIQQWEDLPADYTELLSSESVARENRPILFDIGFMNSSGIEVEPLGKVGVEITTEILSSITAASMESDLGIAPIDGIAMEIPDSALSVDVYHINEKEGTGQDATIEILATSNAEVEIEEGVATAKMEMDSFSTVVFTSNTSVAGGNTYYLNSNVTLASPITLNGGIVNFYLNGYTLTAPSAGSTSSVVIVSDGTFNLYDYYNHSGTGTIICATSVYGSLYAEGNSAVLNIHGGTICGKGSYSTVAYRAGASGSMDNGTVTGAHGQSAGGIEIYAGTFTMSGGMISNTTGGAAVMIGGTNSAAAATFNMSGGTISDCSNTATLSGYMGAVALLSSSAGSSAAFNMSGGVITGNTGLHRTGGVYAYSNASGSAVFTMTGGTISNNTQTNTTYTTAGGGVYAGDNYSVVHLSGGSITGNSTVTEKAGGAYVQKYLYLRGNPKITGNKNSAGNASNLYVKNATIAMEGALSSGASMGITRDASGTFTSGWSTYMGSTNPSSYFSSDASMYSVALSDNEGILKLQDVTVTFYNGSTMLGTQTFTPGSAKSLSTSYQGSVSGYTFYGWATSDSTATRTYTSGQSVTFSENTSLYAIYSREITFYSGLNKETISTVTQYYYGGTAKTIYTPEATSLSTYGYTLIGWYNTSGVTSTVRISTSSTVNTTPAYTTYYAKYRRTVTVNYNGNGASGSTSATTAYQYYNSYGTTRSTPSFTLASSGYTSPTGYNFYQWGTSTASTSGTAAGSSYTYNPAYNATTYSTTLYAIWTRSITFYSGTAKDTSNVVTQYYRSGNSSITSPNASSPNNSWTLMGWTTGTTAAATLSVSTSSTTAFTPSSTTYYAKFKRTLTIAYNKNGGSGTTDSSTGTQYYNSYGNISTPSITLAANGFTAPANATFYQWGTSSTSSSGKAAGSTYTDFSPDVSTATVSTTLYAIWKSTVGSVSITAETYKSAKISLSTSSTSNTASYTGTASSGICTISDVSAGTYYIWASAADDASSIYLYSGKSVSVSGGGTAAATVTYYKVSPSASNATVTVAMYSSNSTSSTKIYTRSNSSYTYLLSGCYAYVTSGTVTGYSTVTLKKGSSTISSGSWHQITATTTFSATGTANTITVNFYQNTTKLGSQTYSYGTAQNLSTSYEGSVSGYNFAGWASGNSTSDITYTSGQSVTNPKDASSGSVSLYAVYSRDVSFYSGKEKSSTDTVTQYYYGGSAQSIVSPSIVTPVSWTAYGWWTGTAASYNRTVAANTSFTPSSVMYYATFSRTITIDYSSNGGVGSMEASAGTQYYNSYGNLSTPAISLASSGFSAPTGYYFYQWGENSTSTSGFTAGSSYNGFSPQADSQTTSKTLYAIWNKQSYTVTYVKDSGNIPNEDSYCSYTYGSGLTLPIPERSNYRFEGWYDNSALSGASVSVISATETGNKTFYAKWALNVASVSFVTDGVDIGPITITIGESFSLPETEKAGYFFQGWYSDSGFTNYVGQAGASCFPTGDCTLYAMFLRVFSVVVPASLPITVSADGSVIISTDATIKNDSSDSVAVTNVNVMPASGWSLEQTLDSGALPVNSKKFTLAITDAASGGTVEKTIQAGHSLPIGYEACVAFQSESISNLKIANVIFTIGWAEVA